MLKYVPDCQSAGRASTDRSSNHTQTASKCLFAVGSNFGKVCAYKCRCSCSGDILSSILPLDLFKRAVNVRSFTFNVRNWNGRGRKPKDIGDFLCFGQTMNMIDTPKGQRQDFEKFTVTPDSPSKNGPYVNYDEIVQDLRNSAELKDCVGCDK